METSLLPDYRLVLVGMLIVFVASANLFNSWTKNKFEQYGFTDQPRHYTTFLRFNIYRLLYVLIMLAGYLVLLACPDFLKLIGADISMEFGEKISEQSYLVAALVIIGVVPKFPIIQEWEANLRDMLQDNAFIPHEAQRLISILENNHNAFQPDREEIRRVLKDIGEGKNSEVDFKAYATDSLRHKWCKLSYLYMMITRKKGENKFIRYISSCDRSLYQRLKNGYADIRKDIDERIDAVEKNNEGGEVVKWVEPIRTETEKLLNSLLNVCYKLISCGILSTEKTPKTRRLAFESFGLNLSPFVSAMPIKWNTVIKSGCVVFGTTFIPTLSYYYYFQITSSGGPLPSIYPESGIKALVWSFLSLAMFGVGLLGAIFVERFVWHRKAKKGENPLDDDNKFMHSFFSGVIGYLIGIAVLVPYTIFYRSGPLTSLPPFIFLFPSLPAVSSFLITYFLESKKTEYFKYFNNRAMEAVMIGFYNAVDAFLVLLILGDFDVPSMLYIIVTAASIGVGIGYAFVEEYRAYLRPMYDRQHERRREKRYAVEENARLRFDDETIPCKVVSIAPSFAAVNINVPGNRTAAHLAIEPMGDFPVIIKKRGKKRTVLQFLNVISGDKLNGFLGKVNAGYSQAMNRVPTPG